MSDIEKITSRISRKLIEAKATDIELQVFGASSHRYHIGQPESPTQVDTLEDRLGIALPNAYRTFVSEVGNGCGKGKDSAAGPFYGIYPLGYGIDELAGLDGSALANPCLMSPDMSEQEWLSLVDELGLNGDLTDDVYEAATCRLFGGLLPLGTQGCCYHHCLVLNGPNAGRVVNVDLDYGYPRFAHEPDFLGWYERWLDEIISGDLLQTSAWFGYQKGGSEAQLLLDFESSENAQTREINLSGLLCKHKLNPATLARLAAAYYDYPEHRFLLCQLVCKSDYERSKPLLTELAQHDRCGFFKCLFWYARTRIVDWPEIILVDVERIADIETFRFFTCMLEELEIDQGAFLIGFAGNTCEQIRAQAFYALGKVGDRERFLSYFIRGLSDADDNVVRNTLQALQGLPDPSLVPHYRALLLRYPVEKNYILSNLNHRLKEMGLSRTMLREGSTPTK
jgi:hypothetical protein